jgi:phosphomannomutase
MAVAASSLKFGTSGLRGLAVELEGQAARRYTAAFLRHLQNGIADTPRQVFLGADFRPSSAAIVRDCAVAIEAAGLEAVDCGTLPTPALALHAIAAGGAAIMVTGSHIPADRNGLKFYLPTGEISKADEAGIVASLEDAVVPDAEIELLDEADEARERYLERYAHFLPPGALAGKRIGVFEHSTVARDLLGEVLQTFGADVLSLGRIDGFVPVDTEAFADAVFAPLRGWIEAHRLDAIVSADGDGDRPLLMDNEGQFVRGDVLGILAARYLGATTVVTPVTSNSAIERMGLFETVVRTRVGSPFVVEAMEKAEGSTIGFEANGGTFVGKGVSANGAALGPLVTRDAILPLLSVLGEAARQAVSVAQLVAALPLQHALADRLQDVPGEKSAAFLTRLSEDADYAAAVFGEHGISDVARIDGLQFWTGSGDMVHYRASGNAPELRCYVEAGSPERARELLDWGLARARRELGL